MPDPFPHYDVLEKRDTPSWNAKSREVIDARLALVERDGGLGAERVATLRRIADRVVPQPEDRRSINVVALVLQAIVRDNDGFRHTDLPETLTAWRKGLDAIEAEARLVYRRNFVALGDDEADALLSSVESGKVRSEAWQDLPPSLFWNWRLIPDLVSAYWAHPSAWSAMGFGGPAGPRGYVRTETGGRDPWEAVEER